MGFQLVVQLIDIFAASDKVRLFSLSKKLTLDPQAKGSFQQVKSRILGVAYKILCHSYRNILAITMDTSEELKYLKESLLPQASAQLYRTRWKQYTDWC
jgi:hypothetical protein